MRVFELIGPIMFGPSSSHTAGACRLSRAMWQILGENVTAAKLDLHGSFRVKEGGEVNKALVAGLLGFDTDDDRINNSHALMEQSGIDFSYGNVLLEGAHNNSVRYHVKNGDFGFTATGASVGGGMIEVSDINGAPLSITGDYNTLIVFCSELEGVKAALEKMAGEMDEVTVETAQSPDGGTKIAMLKTSHPVTDEMIKTAAQWPDVIHASRHRRFD